MKFFNRSKKPSYGDLEVRYEEVLGEAFQGAPRLRGKLLHAVSLFDQKQFVESMTHLQTLNHRAQTSQDRKAILFLTAMILTVYDQYEKALGVYGVILQEFPDCKPVWERVSKLHTLLGDEKSAQIAAEKAKN